MTGKRRCNLLPTDLRGVLERDNQKKEGKRETLGVNEARPGWPGKERKALGGSDDLVRYTQADGSHQNWQILASIETTDLIQVKLAWARPGESGQPGRENRDHELNGESNSLQTRCPPQNWSASILVWPKIRRRPRGGSRKDLGT